MPPTRPVPLGTVVARNCGPHIRKNENTVPKLSPQGNVSGGGAQIVRIGTGEGSGPHVMAATRWTEIRLSSDGEHVGKVSEIMLDVRSRRIAYAVLAEGGFLGMGTTLHARPWNALTLDTDEKCFRVDITAQKINEPGFATHRYYNRTPTGLRLRFRGNTND